MSPDLSSGTDPSQEYADRLQRRRRRAADLDRSDWRLSLTRGLTLLAGIVTAWAVFDPDRLHVAWLAVPMVVFLVLVVVHERVARQRRCIGRSIAYYERGLARLEDRWEGLGYDGACFRDDAHPYANDLDLFGVGSLYQLVCAARTGIGRQTLAAWLLERADRAEIEARQAAVRELAEAIDLREELAVFGADIVGEVHPHELSDWATAGPLLDRPAYRWIAPTLVVFLIAAALGLLTGVSGRVLLGIAFALHASFALTLRRRVDTVIAGVSRAGHELRLLGGVLEHIERGEFKTPSLRQMVAGLQHRAEPPSASIARLHRLIALLDSRRNQFFAPLAAILLWGTQLAIAIERWRATIGPAIPHWLEIVGEFEALSSLGAYRYEHPHDPFPEIVDGPASFEGHAVGHPLLPDAECVRNDVSLGPDTALLVVSGSNMSGKSTLMRTVGINCVLGLAGAPVRATALRLSPLQVGGTLRVQDSLRRGTSGFYAEIERFRQLVNLAGKAPPLLFLLEEILNTTNSHDRRIGARAVIQGLLEAGSIGLVTTHDLAITEIVEHFDGAQNVHFVDHLEGGAVVFDYVLRPGVVDKSNALDLMRSIGLDV